MNQPTLQDELFAAICANEEDTVLKLLFMGADAAIPFSDGLTPLMVAARAGALAVIPALLDYGAQAGLCDARGRNALNWLCRFGTPSPYHHRERRAEAVRRLLLAGDNPYTLDDEELSPFWIACRRGLPQVLQLIHELSPIPLEMRHSSGDTPLLMACRYAHSEETGAGSGAVELLIGLGADTYALDNEGKTPREIYRYPQYMDWSRRAPHSAFDIHKPIHTHIRRKDSAPSAASARTVDLHATDTRGRTALHIYAALGHYEAVAILLERGAEVDCSNLSGATPLMLAARGEQDERVAALLLAYGADFTRTDKRGKSALDYAAASGKYRLLNMMGEFGSIPFFEAGF